MIALSHYQALHKIYESASSLVYRSVREGDDRPVILKVLKGDDPTQQALTRYEREYEIASSLNLPGAIAAYSLEKYQNSLCIIFEDFGGESLKRLMRSRRFSIQEFLYVAIATAKSLSEIHAARIIHKDINPSNIVLNPETGQLKIIDFGMATTRSQERFSYRNPNALEGTLAYLSPEQTGRMNRSLDYRTDFYSLGATFYELLAQRPLFDAQTPMEWIHCHVANKPYPPHKINPEIPKAVSSIVMKLLAKTAEDRYQSALGIQSDLEACLKQLQIAEKIPDFPLGCNDISDKFQIPRKLYGREREIEILLAAFQRISSNKQQQRSSQQQQQDWIKNIATKNNPQSDTTAKSEMLLISGYSGIGKSALVQELYQPITQQQGYFITGKFEQYQKNIPYSGIVHAFQSLVKQLLTEGEEELSHWRKKLLAVLGSNGQIVINAIPEIEMILGQQPAVPELDPKESQNRFNLVLKNFIQTFSQPEHPLVIFLDDLQWADSASLKLIEKLMLASDSSHLLLVCAYRDNEVSIHHPLMMTLAKIQAGGAIVSGICLAPLEISHISELISETLKCSTEKVRSLAELVLTKTNGNPFFSNEFLRSLYSENLLYFNYECAGWQWDLEKIKLQDIADNVVGLVERKIRRLPVAVQNSLQLAACIGNQFDLRTLASIGEQDMRETALWLQDAISAGLILPLTNNFQSIEEDVPAPGAGFKIEYKFAHDRIQQAAYSLIPDNQKQTVHWRIGKIFLQIASAKQREEKIFDIVNHLNFGLEHTNYPVSSIHFEMHGSFHQQGTSYQNGKNLERNELAKLNLVAGKKAKAAAAYEAAFSYFEIGICLLGKECWEKEYELSLVLYKSAAEAAYLSSNFEQAEVLSQLALGQAKTLLEKVSLYEIQIQFYIARNQMQCAIELGLEILEKLGVFLSELAPNNLLPEELIQLHRMTAPDKLAAMRILASLFAPVFIDQPDLLPKIAFTMVNLCTRHGNSSLSAFAYGFHGMLLCGLLNDIELGYQFGKLALKILDKFDAREIKCKVYHLFNAHTRFWKELARDSIEPLCETIQFGLETGDVEYACYASLGYCHTLFLSGEPLELVYQKQKQYISLIQKLKQEHPLPYASIWGQLGLNLQGQATGAVCSLTGELFDEVEILPVLLDTNNLNSIFSMYLAKTILSYLFKDYIQADMHSSLAKEYAQSVVSLPTVPQQNFYHSLVLLARYPRVEACQQRTYLEEVSANQKKMQVWATFAPMNFQHKYDLVEAEKARILGQVVEAMEAYEQAIKGAKENGYIQDEALGYELAAEFYLARNMEDFAQLYMTKARDRYIRWQAWAKVESLESCYSQFFAKRTVSPMCNSLTSLESGSDTSAALDLNSILKASQALSDEIVLESLLAKLMKIAIENAGAEKGYLILPSQSGADNGNLQWAIEASGMVDSKDVAVLQSIPILSAENGRNPLLVSSAIVNYAIQTQESVVLNDAAHEGSFVRDSYIVEQRPKSVLCMPLLNQHRLAGILYLENNLATGVFTPERLEVLNLLSSQAAIAIENAQLYADASERQNQLTQFLEAMPVAIGMLDRRGNPYYTNQRAIELLGKGVVPDAAAEEIAEVYQLYIAGTNQIYPVENLPIVRALRGEQHSVEDVEIHQGNQIIPVEAWGTPIYDKQGHIVYAMAAFQDIAERKQMEQALENQNRTLEAQVVERTEALRESEQRFRNAFESSAGGMVLVSLEGRFLAVNASACQIWGYSEQELLSMTFYEITHPADLELGQRPTQQLLAGDVPHYDLEKRYLHKNGQTIWGLLSVSLVRDGQQTPLYTIAQIQDITARKILEQKLAVREARLNAFFASAPIGMVIMDSDLRFVQINEPLAQINGCSVQEHVGKSLHDVIPAIAPQVEQLYQQVLSTGTPILNLEMSGEVPSQPGVQRHWVVSHFPIPDGVGCSDGFGSVVFEITDRKRAEQELGESRAQYKSLVDALPQCLYRTDRELRLTFANQAFLSTIGCSLEDCLGKTAADFYPPELAAKYTADNERILRTGETLDIVERHQAPEMDTPIYVQVVKTPIRNADGQIVGTQGIFWDVTERQRREEALRLIVEGTAATTGSEFFRSCVRSLAEVLHVHYACVTELMDESRSRVRTLAFWAGDDWVDNCEYDLAGTPCENVFEGQLCYYPNSVQSRFPGDRDLIDLGVHSYLGIPLMDSAGQALGHLAVLDVRPMDTGLGQESILRIFAARAGAELERQQAEEALVGQMRLEALGRTIGVALTQCDTLREMLGDCAIALQQHLNAAFARIWTLNKAENVLELQASAGLSTYSGEAHSRIPVGQLKIGWIAQQRQAYLTNDTGNDPHISDRIWVREEGIVAFAGYPLMLEDQLLGVMAVFACQPLSQKTLEAMGSVANEIAVGIDRKWSEQALQHQVEKDSLLNQISRAFIDQDVETAIEFALQSIGQFVGCDRSGILHYDENQQAFIPTYKWSSDGVSSSEYAERFPADYFPWFYQQLVDRKPIVIHQLADLPLTATATRAALEQRSIQSLLAVPLIHVSKVVGFMDLSTTRHLKAWTQDDIRLLEFAGELIVIAEARHAAEEALRTSEQRYRSIYDNTPVMLHSIDCNGKLISVSNYWLQILGYERHEVLGRSSTDFLTEESRRYAREVILPRYFKSGVCTDVSYQFVKKNGETIDVLLSATAERDRSGRVVRSQAILVDVTQRKQAQALLTGQNLILEMIAYGAPLKEVLDFLARLVEDQSQQMLCSFLLLEKDNRLHFGAAPSLPDTYNQVIDSQGVAIGPQVGSCGTAAYRQETVVVTDIASDPLWAAFRELALAHGLRACWSTPILSAGGTLLGTFAGYYRTPQPPSEHDQELVAQTIYLAKIAIERQRSQETLQETSTRLTLAIEANRDGLFDINLKTDEYYFSPQWRNLIGYPLDRPGPRRTEFLSLVHPEDRDLVEAVLGELASGARSQWQIEFRMLHREGSTPWILSRGQLLRDENGEPVRLSGTHTDISDRKRAEDEIREMSNAMKNAVEGLSRLDPQGRYTFVNRAYANTCGYEPEELLAREWPITVHPDDRSLLVDAYIRMKAVGKIEAEARGVRKDGSLFYKQVTMVSAYNERGEFNGHYCFMKDISDRKRAEAELQQAKEAAEIANQAKSEFLANMSHEIRTPMNGVLGMADLLTKTPLNPDQQDLVHTLKDSASNLMLIVNDILDLSKLEAGKVQLEILDFDLKTCLQEVVGLLFAQASAKGLALSASVPSDIPIALKGDPVRLRQILMNLVGNAIKFTATGEVTIVVSREESDSKKTGKSTINHQPSTIKMRFEVRDTGIGIAPADQNKVFHKFSQVDASTTRLYGGTGLGLSICQQLVELMDGEIGLTSQLGQGSTFWFEIPFELQPENSLQSSARKTVYLPANNRLAPTASEARDPAQLAILKLLLVEDNPVNQKVALRQLQRLGCQADCASNGQEALDKLAVQNYDIVLMDCQMPILDGYQATQALRQRERDTQRHTIVISLTAGAMKGDREKCLAAGMDDYITKPVVLADLEDVLWRWLPTATQPTDSDC